MTKIEIIDDTVAYYSADVSRRSVYLDQCLYKSPNGNECAFQRCVNTDLSDPELNGFSAHNVIQNREIIFKDLYDGHESLFWNDIQSLHDKSAHWDKSGLTVMGECYIQQLKGKYSPLV